MVTQHANCVRYCSQNYAAGQLTLCAKTMPFQVNTFVLWQNPGLCMCTASHGLCFQPTVPLYIMNLSICILWEWWGRGKWSQPPWITRDGYIQIERLNAERDVNGLALADEMRVGYAEEKWCSSSPASCQRPERAAYILMGKVRKRWICSRERREEEAQEKEGKEAERVRTGEEKRREGESEEGEQARKERLGESLW